jgi:aminocarboxymuconate-semialdehyde decarboxylase
LNIDTHGHFVPMSFLEGLAQQRRLFPSVKIINEKPGMRFIFGGAPPSRPVGPLLHDLGKRKEWLEKARVNYQLVGSWLDIFGYELPAEEGADWCRFMNETMLNDIKALPALKPLACVPLQSGKHAAQVLEEALAQGFHGAMIGTQPKGASGVLDDPDLDPFWEAASARKATLFVHPTFGARDDRLKAYGLVSAVGRVTDTTLAVARLLYSGHLVRYPNVNLVISHGGAALPMVFGRLKRSFATAPAQNADPALGFHKLYFDSVVYDAPTVRFVCEMAGVDRVLMGTDEPFAIAEQQPVKLIEACNFSTAERQAILGGTAAKLFGIP